MNYTKNLMIIWCLLLLWTPPVFGSHSNNWVADTGLHPDQTDQPMGVVIIDDDHQNDYTSGDMTNVADDLQQQGYIVKYSSEFSSFGQAVQASNYLVISAPFNSFTSEDIQSIVDWFDTGSRNLVLASRGDFSQPDYTSMNAILAGLGATSRIQDDNVYTTDTSVPKAWYIDTDNFNSTGYSTIFSDVKPLSFFSPSSINPGSAGHVLVYAEDPAYQSNEKGAAPDVIFDNTDDGTGGSSIPLAVYETVSVGNLSDHIISMGTTMWSDFDYGDVDYGDISFFNNALLYLRARTLEAAGQIDLNVDDTEAPEVHMVYPHNNAYLKGTVELEMAAFDAFGVTSTSISINDQVVSHSLTYSWDTTTTSDGIYTIIISASDAAGHTSTKSYSYSVQQNFQPSLPENAKFMTYNIKQSGVYPAWYQVVLEENPDIMILVETGDFDNNNNQILKSVVADLNSYFFDEIPYSGYTLQNIQADYNGITLISRFDISSPSKLSSLTDDGGKSVTVPLPFLHAIVDMGGQDVHILGAHLTCCPGQDNWEARLAEQESIINYMDDLGHVPIIYAGDMNSLSPDDVKPADQSVATDLGTGPIEMLVDPQHAKASTVHTFIDVAKILGNKTDTYHGSVDSRIDYIFVNRYFEDSLLSSTTGDTPSAASGSDHVPVDFTFNITKVAKELPISSGQNQSASDGNKVGVNSSNVFFLALLLLPLLRRSKSHLG